MVSRRVFGDLSLTRDFAFYTAKSLPLSRLKSELFSAFAYPRLSKSAKNVSKLAKSAGLGHKGIAGFEKSSYICSSCDVRGNSLPNYKDNIN